MKNILYFVCLSSILKVINSFNIRNNPNSVFTIPYVRSFRSDKINIEMGCGHNVVFAEYQYPSGPSDALHTYLRSSYSQITCLYKKLFAKVFGRSQNYRNLKDPKLVAKSMKVIGSKIKNIIIDWQKQIEEDNLQYSQNYLTQLINHLKQDGFSVFLKAPATYFCYQIQNQPFILGVHNANGYIIEMYGEEPNKYKTYEQIFTSETTQTSTNYPNQNCPKFPSYNQLVKSFPDGDFYIQKTLQIEEYGYLGEEMNQILQKGEKLYKKYIFYDGFPQNLIRI